MSHSPIWYSALNCCFFKGISCFRSLPGTCGASPSELLSLLLHFQQTPSSNQRDFTPPLSEFRNTHTHRAKRGTLIRPLDAGQDGPQGRHFYYMFAFKGNISAFSLKAPLSGETWVRAAGDLQKAAISFSFILQGQKPRHRKMKYFAQLHVFLLKH